MNSVDLTGLSVASPIGFMAALGLLRVCAQDHGQPVGLSWGPATARLEGIGCEALLELLDAHLRGRSQAPEFNLEVPIKGDKHGPMVHLREIPPADYRAAARAWRGDARALGFLAGYGTDAVVSDKGYVARTAFDFSSANQKLALEFRRLAQLLDPTERRPRVPFRVRVERALFGGPYEDQHSFGWDPATLMTHAHQPEAPTDSITPGQPMLIWLAVESLPLHPVLPLNAQRVVTTGFVGSRAYAWPQWGTALSLAEVRTLRQRAVSSLDDVQGVHAVWSAGITTVGKFRFFQPAARTPSDRLIPQRFAMVQSAW